MQIHKSKNPQISTCHRDDHPQGKPNRLGKEIVKRKKYIRHRHGASLHSGESRKEEKFVAKNHKEHLEILKGNNQVKQKCIEFHTC